MWGSREWGGQAGGGVGRETEKKLYRRREAMPCLDLLREVAPLDHIYTQSHGVPFLFITRYEDLQLSSFSNHMRTCRNYSVTTEQDAKTPNTAQASSVYPFAKPSNLASQSMLGEVIKMKMNEYVRR